MMAFGRRVSLVLAGLAVGCGAEPEVEPPPERVADAAPTDVAKAAAGDELLRRAREQMREGALPAEVEEAVLGSTEPAHARARRVLLAMQEPPPGDDAGEGSEGDAQVPAPLVPPATDVTPPPVESEGPASERPSSTSRPPPPRRGSSRVGKLSFQSTARGATLTIKGSSKLVVGVANQPSSGIVRVIVEKAEASPTVLSARPTVDGARVTGVRQGRDTLQVTVKLDPGWTLGGVTPFSGGAKVNLVAPR